MSALEMKRASIFKSNIKGVFMLPILTTIPTCVEIAIGTAAFVAGKKLAERE